MNQKQQSFLKIPLLDKVLTAFVPAALVLILIGSFLFISQYKKEQVNYIYDSLYESSSNKSMYLTDQLEFNMNLLRALATFSDVYSMDREQQEVFFASRAAILGYAQFFTVDTNGMAYYLGTREEKDLSKDSLFKNVKDNTSYISEPYYEDDEPNMTFCTAIFDETGARVGTLCATFNLSYIQDIISNAKSSLSIHCFIVNEDGEFVAVNKGDDEAQLGNALGNGKNNFEIVTDALSSKKDKQGIITVNDTEYYASAIYMAKTNWCLVECTDSAVLNSHILILEIGELLITLLMGLLLFANYHIIYSWKTNYRKLHTDPLCGCGSRAACLEKLDEMDRDSGKRYSVLYMDLNNFKTVNDTFGHDKGDEILKIFAEVLMKYFGEIGFVGRMGGDEFVGFFEDVSKNKIQNTIKAVDRELANRSKRLKFDYVITASYGYVDGSNGRGKTMNDLMRQADNQMYDDKREKKMAMEDK